MKLEEIKNMSDEEFVELVIKNMEDYEGKISPASGLDKYYSVLIGLLLLLFSYLCVGLDDKKMELGTFATMLLAFLGGYVFSRWATCDDKEKLIEELRKKIIFIKDKIERMNEEEFNSLIENSKTIKRKMVSDEVFDSAKALSVANSIIEIDATRILDEFEKSNVNSENNNYKDDTLDVQKGASFKINGHFY